MRFAALFLSIPAFAADSFEALGTEIRRQLTESGAASLSVALARDGKIVWEEGFGWADKAARRRATAHTMYSLASISKPITATGLMRLVESGRVKLDAPVDEYLGAAKIRGRAFDASQATVRRIANHSSGLPLHYQFFYEDEPYRRPSMDDTILRYANLVTAPGERYQYSNLGYGILDSVVSRVSGKPYADYMREQVFEPLGLTHTSVNVPAELAGHQAVRYDPTGAPIPFYDFDHPGGSAVYSSAHDLVRFGMFHLGEKLEDQRAILSAASLEEMRKPTMMTGPKAWYGVGWAIADGPGGYRVISHTGSMGGVATSLRLIPSERIALAVLCNSGVALPHRVADRILARVPPKWKEPAPGMAPVAAPKFEPAPDLQGVWRGSVSTYKRDLPLRLEFRSDGLVRARLGDQLETLVNTPAFRDGMFTGRINGDLGTEDVNRRPYTIQLSLTLRGAALNGSASALSNPGRRAGNALSHWVEARKE